MNGQNPAYSVYPTTVQGVIAYGLERWMDIGRPNIFHGKYRQIYSAVFDAYKSAFANPDSAPHCQYCAVINYKTISYFSHIIHERACLYFLKQEGYAEILRGARPESLSSVESRNRDLNFDNIAFSLSHGQILLEKLRAVKLNRGEPSVFHSCFPQNSRNGIYILGDKTLKEISEYISEEKLRPVVLRPRIYENPDKKLFDGAIFEKEKKYLYSAVRTFFEALREKLPQFSSFFGAETEEAFLKFYLATFESLFSTVKRIERWRSAKKLLVTHVGNIHHRIFAAAWKIIGKETIGFSHGNIYPYAYMPGDIMNGAMDILDKFVVVSKGEKKLLEDAVRDFNPAFGKKIKFVALRNSAYRQIFDKIQSQDIDVSQIRKIMLIGHPMDNFNSPYLDFISSLSIFDLEIRLIKDLKFMGFKVIYKAHPDTLSVVSGIFENLTDAVETGRFEENYHEADCILFTKPFSTTFGYALMTKKPVVLLSHRQFAWHKDILPLLEKRVSLLDAELNEHGRITYNKEELKTAIESSIARLDYELVQKYAF